MNFDMLADVDTVIDDIKKSQPKTGYVDAPCGVYNVELKKLELGTSKAGKPMVKGWMKIVDGEYKDAMLYMNQVVQLGFQIQQANTFMRSLGTGVVVEYLDNDQYKDMIDRVFKRMDGQQFTVEYSLAKGKFPQYRVR